MNGRGERGGAIAIIGIACQFPGARDPAEFHDLTVAGTALYRPVSGSSGRILHAALLDGWGATPHDTGSIHKLTAETIALALADAGFRLSGPGSPSHRAGSLTPGDGSLTPGAGSRVARTRVGLLVASSVPDVCAVACEGFGIDPALRFPPTAYPSSPHAIAAACDALRAGELDVTIAGGVELGIDPRWLARQAAAGTLGGTQMRVYDAEPVGVLPGDGCGIVILVRAADARAQAKPSYAEIAGWAVVDSPTADSDPVPGVAGLGLLGAYGQARVDPADIQLVEGHGAGTAAGETAELEALVQLRRGSKSWAALGAVSATIGHTRAASGVASLIKTVTAMVAGTIPPGTGCPHPHPLLESGDARLRLPAAPEPWPGTTRLAAVNSFVPSIPPPRIPRSAPEPTGPDAMIHFVLRREADNSPTQGRRRRATARPETPGDMPGSDQHPLQSPSLGRHTAPPPPSSQSTVNQPANATPRSANVAVPAQRARTQEPTAPPADATRPSQAGDRTSPPQATAEPPNEIATHAEAISASHVANGARIRHPIEGTAARQQDDGTRAPVDADQATTRQATNAASTAPAIDPTHVSRGSDATNTPRAAHERRAAPPSGAARAGLSAAGTRDTQRVAEARTPQACEDEPTPQHDQARSTRAATATSAHPTAGSSSPQPADAAYPQPPAEGVSAAGEGWWSAPPAGATQSRLSATGIQHTQREVESLTQRAEEDERMPQGGLAPSMRAATATPARPATGTSPQPADAAHTPPPNEGTPAHQAAHERRTAPPAGAAHGRLSAAGTHDTQRVAEARTPQACEDEPTPQHDPARSTRAATATPAHPTAGSSSPQPADAAYPQPPAEGVSAAGEGWWPAPPADVTHARLSATGTQNTQREVESRTPQGDGLTLSDDRVRSTWTVDTGQGRRAAEGTPMREAGNRSRVAQTDGAIATGELADETPASPTGVTRAGAGTSAGHAAGDARTGWPGDERGEYRGGNGADADQTGRLWAAQAASKTRTRLADAVRDHRDAGRGEMSQAAGQPHAGRRADGAGAGWGVGPVRVQHRNGPGLVFGFCGVEEAGLAATLDAAAHDATELGEDDLRALARQLAGIADSNASWGGGLLRVAVTAATPGELAAAARQAAHMVRAAHTGNPASPRGAPILVGAHGVPAAGIAMSVGATGTLTAVFPGFADTAAEHTSLLAGSLDALRLLKRLGTNAATAVGYSFGEVTGLVWAGCLRPAEAARIAALRGRMLRGCVARPTAMARVRVDVDLARKLVAADGQPTAALCIAAYETATSHLLAGPASAIRDLARRGAEIGVPVDVLPVAGAMHSPAMADCAAPLRTVLAGTAFGSPRPGLISTVTGQPVATDEDVVGLLAEQITRPVLFAQAMALAAERTDLVVVAGPGGDPASGPAAHAEPSLAALAAAASGAPAIQLPRAADAPTIAALFVAGAIKELTPLIANESAPRAPSQDTSDAIDVRSSWTIPPARNGRNGGAAYRNGTAEDRAATGEQEHAHGQNGRRARDSRVFR